MHEQNCVHPSWEIDRSESNSCSSKKIRCVSRRGEIKILSNTCVAIQWDAEQEMNKFYAGGNDCEI